MVDAVLSYHADSLTCGVTRFSQQLAKRLGVDWRQCNARHSDLSWPLFSLKPTEITDTWCCPDDVRYDVFLHEPYDAEFIERAHRVFAASSAIAADMRAHRPDVIPAWCPSLVEAHPREPITVLSFGMAHKLRTDLYATLKDKLDATGEPYVVYVSAALHEGTTFSQASASFDALRKLFGPNFVFLGTLSDEAMVDRLRRCTYVAAFFEKGLRENNTSVMAAIDAGATVITNHDEHTPWIFLALTQDVHGELRHAQTRRLLRERYGWDKLVELIRG